MKLSKHAFLALAAVAWADGRLAPDEASALLRAAKEHGVEGTDLATIERATKERVTLADVASDALTPFEAAVTYGLASWLARIDGVVKPEEHEGLLALAKHLGLAPKARDAAAAAAFDVAMLKSGDRPAKYDFGALVARIEQRLPSLAK